MEVAASNKGTCYKKTLESILPNFFFSVFFFFGVKLGHFTINNFFSLCNENASLPAKKRKNSLLAKKKSLVGSSPKLSYLKKNKLKNHIVKKNRDTNGTN